MYKMKDFKKIRYKWFCIEQKMSSHWHWIYYIVYNIESWMEINPIRWYEINEMGGIKAYIDMVSTD